MNEVYRSQVDLLLKVLPYVAQEKNFALKGGTAINLFVRDMPRLSVDIDLSYLPFDDRAAALSNITASLYRIKKQVDESKQGIKTTSIPQKDGSEAKLSCQREKIQIIIEVNTTIRGHLLEPKMLSVTDKVQDEFEQFAEIMVISNGELFGGKICAALDRQHPRDLFDVHYLLKNEGITHEIKLGFIACVLSHPRPIHELLNPNFQDQREAFARQFSGMTIEEYTYEDFENTRIQLVDEIRDSLDDNDIDFLLSFKKGEPEWSLFEIEKLKEMPAVKWKLLNIQKLSNNDAKKHQEMYEALEDLFIGR
jgi:predicted nucleotidyltransferase component of viral defense system